MPSSRIFVSYVCVGDEPGARIGKQLLTDIRATSTEAVSDHETISDTRFMPFLMKELPQCGYLIVVQTPTALQSWRVQSTLAMASALVAQQRLRVCRVIAVPSDEAEGQALWSSLPAFDARVDYPRAREKLFLALSLVRLNDADDSFIASRPVAVRNPARSFPAEGHQQQPQASAPVSRPIGSNWPAQPSAPMPRTGSSDWPGQPSGPMSQPIGSDWPGQPSGVPQQPVRTNWPAQTPFPGGTNWPLQPPGPQPGIPPSMGLPAAAAARPENGSDSMLKNLWLKTQTAVSRLGSATSQTSIAAQPARFFKTPETPLANGDHPPQLHPSRRFVTRWMIVTGILLLLLVLVTLIVLFVRSHLHH